jgi:hypothetical protein
MGGSTPHRGGEAPVAGREARDLGSRVPSLTAEMVRERELEERLQRRVDRVMAFETELARVGAAFEAGAGPGGLLGTWVQRLVLPTNLEQRPVRVPRWAEELERVVGQAVEGEAGEQVVADHLLWGAVRGWWERVGEGRPAGREECAGRVLRLLGGRVQRAGVAEWLGARRGLAEEVRGRLAEGGWVAGPAPWAALDTALAAGQEGTLGLSGQASYIENLFQLEQTPDAAKHSEQPDIARAFEIITNQPTDSSKIERTELDTMLRVHLAPVLDRSSVEAKRGLRDRLAAAGGGAGEELLDGLVTFLTMQLLGRVVGEGR